MSLPLRSRRRFRALLATGVLPAVFSTLSTLRADEGMWLYNQLPRDLLSQRHEFEPSAEWARRLMRSSARLSTGGSGSVVSATGLVMTNHHVVSSLLHQLSSEEKNYVEDGFFAHGLEEEVRCPNVEIHLLWEIEDVTERVGAAVPTGASPGEAEKARRGAIASIEKESQDSTGFHSEVVALYRGGRYHLYRYKRYDDVRMVFAPEVAIAYFGGDADNFEFPRHCLDVSFVRLYEDDKPALVEEHLRWSRRGVREGDLVFVSGHPGRTSRLNTVDHLRFLRDVAYPSFLEIIYRREVALQQFGLRSAEHKRRAKDDLFGVENSRKAIRGMLAGLQDPAVLDTKLREERVLQASIAANSSLGASLDDWERVRFSLVASERIRDDYNFFANGRAFWSTLFGHARTLVRLSEESQKPNAERLPEFRETAIPSLRLQLESSAPIHADLETFELADSLSHVAETYGVEHPLVRLVLGDRSPADRAFELVSKTGLASVETRKELFENALSAEGKAALDGRGDPMLDLARKVDAFSRASRETFEDLVSGVQRDAYANLANANFAVSGTAVYPDATFTLRLAFGVVKGWQEGAVSVPYRTTFGGAFERAATTGNASPYALPASWRAKAEGPGALDRSVPFNFVSTPDIIGGNSGSPVVDRKGDVVGIIFDGNIHGLVLDFVYTEERARSVSVNAEAIIAALGTVYGMDRIVAELQAD